MYCRVIVFELTLHFGWNFYPVSSLLPHSFYSFVFHYSFFSEISLNNLFKHELPSANEDSSLPYFIFIPTALIVPSPNTCTQCVHTHIQTHTHRVCIHSAKYILHYSIIAGYVFSYTCSLLYFKCLTKWYALNKCLI